MKLQEEAAELRKRTAPEGKLTRDRHHSLHEKAKQQQQRRKEAVEERAQEVEQAETAHPDLTFSPRITKMAKNVGGHQDLPFRQPTM